jgi:hypothetical protein
MASPSGFLHAANGIPQIRDFQATSMHCFGIDSQRFT